MIFFPEKQPAAPIFYPQKEWRNFGIVESRTIWRETKKIKTKMATTYNKAEQQQYLRNIAEL
jgi:hypothetical protein